MYQDITNERPSSFEVGKWNGGYLPWGKDNRYPNRLSYLIKESFTATSCHRKLTSFIKGLGFKDSEQLVGKVKLGRLWERICNSASSHNTFALHVNYNLQYKISEINFIPVENCRWKIPDEGVDILEIGLSDSWGINILGTPSNVVDIDIFNPDPKVVREQIQKKGIAKYKGQIYLHTEYGDIEYPLSVFHSSRESIETEREVKRFSNSNVRNGFRPSQVFVKVGDFGSEDEKKEYKAQFEQNTGAKGGAVSLLKVKNKDQIPVSIPLNNRSYDKEFELTKEAAKEDIRNSCFGIQPILLGWKGQNQLAANVQEIKEATEFFASETRPLQDRLVVAVNEILENSIFNHRIDNIEPFHIIKDDNRSNGINDNTIAEQC